MRYYDVNWMRRNAVMCGTVLACDKVHFIALGQSLGPFKTLTFKFHSIDLPENKQDIIQSANSVSLE